MDLSPLYPFQLKAPVKWFFEIELGKRFWVKKHHDLNDLFISHREHREHGEKHNGKSLGLGGILYSPCKKKISQERDGEGDVRVKGA